MRFYKLLAVGALVYLLTYFLVISAALSAKLSAGQDVNEQRHNAFIEQVKKTRDFKQQLKAAEESRNTTQQELDAAKKKLQNSGNVSSPAKPLSNIITSGSVYEQFNQYRAAHQLSPVSVSASLAASAQAHAERMAASGYGHSGYGGEIIAFGSPSIEAYYGHGVVTAWYNSAGHRAIMLGNYSSVGYGEFASGGTIYYVAWFGN